MHSLPFWRDIAIAPISAAILAIAAWAREYFTQMSRGTGSLVIPSASMSERKPNEANRRWSSGVKDSPQGRLIATDVGRLQGALASIAILAGGAVGGIDKKQMGVDMRIGMSARLVDVLGRYKNFRLAARGEERSRNSGLNELERGAI